MNYVSKISKLLRTPEEVILSLENKMSDVTGKKKVLEEIVLENDEKVKRVLSVFKINNPTAQEVYSALIEQAKQTDKCLFDHFQKPSYSTETGCKVLINSVSELTGNLQGFYLKEEKAKEFLKLNPPKNIMASLGYGSSIDRMLEKEDVFEVFSALRFVEDSRWLNDVFFKPYEKLSRDDFERREIKIMVLPQKWLGIGRDFLGKKLHHMSHLKELGVVFIIPVAEQFSGETLYLFFMILHYIFEVDWHSRLFEVYSKKSDFAEKIINTLKVEVSGDLLPNSGKMSWRVISKYLAKNDPNDLRLFEPHINTEAWHFHKAGLAIEKLSRRFPEIGLDFWKSLNICGEYFPLNNNSKEILISFDMFDVGISLLQRIGFKSKYLYHQQEALWTEIFRRYMGEKETDKILIENIGKGYVTL
ncbi:hypothetical protein ACFLZ0_02190 [Patescibacteria group bacterium]